MENITFIGYEGTDRAPFIAAVVSEIELEISCGSNVSAKTFMLRQRSQIMPM